MPEAGIYKIIKAGPLFHRYYELFPFRNGE